MKSMSSSDFMKEKFFGKSQTVEDQKTRATLFSERAGCLPPKNTSRKISQEKVGRQPAFPLQKRERVKPEFSSFRGKKARGKRSDRL